MDAEGTLPGLEDETRALEQRLTRGRIAVSEIFDAASELEAAYVRAGFILARVVLPAQELRDGGRLRLVIVDGFVESIDTEAVPDRVRERIEALTESLVGQRGLQRRELERQLLLAGDTYGIALGSALAAGATPGGTVIILQPRFRQVTGFVGFDNGQTEELGEWVVNGGVELNGYLGFGEAIYGRVSGFPGLDSDDGFFSSTPRNRTLAVGTVVPIGTSGLSFNIEYSDSRTTPDNDLVPTTSKFERLSLRAFYPVVRSRAFNMTTQASLDLQQDSLDILSVAGDLPVYQDETAVLRFATDAAWLPENGSVIEAGGILSFGLDSFGARTASNAAGGTPLSRAGADADFTKLELSARLRQPLGSGFSATVSARGQLSFGDPLLTSEQIGFASAQELSAFEEGTLTGDSGWVIRGEIARVVELEAASYPLDLRPYVFAATGTLHREVPAFGEAETVRASAYGVGVEAFLVRDQAFSTASIRLELAGGDRDDGGPDGTRVTLYGSLRF